jgi:hypothetical protein
MNIGIILYEWLYFDERSARFKRPTDNGDEVVETVQ